MNTKYNNYVLKRKRLNKTKIVIIFRRNNLSFDNLVETGDGLLYDESFSYRGLRCHFKLLYKSKNPYDIFSVDSKTFRIKGGKSSFGIFIRLNDQKELPISVHKEVGLAEYTLLVEGKKIWLDDSRMRNKEIGSDIHDISMKHGSIVPGIVSWRASHPASGGGVSPR